jgi:aminopeptidase YwaD
MVVLAGALAQDTYMPKHFPFLTLEDQQRVIQRLEAAQPEAVIGLHASPLFCDADFRLPSVTLSPTEGAALLDCAGEVAALRIISHTSPSTGGNIVARGISHSAKRIVICAHFDTWFNTPGALDNAAGVAALLVLAGLLDPRRAGVELVAFNGEDNYAAPGQVVYLRSGVAEIAYVINIDGIGAVGKPNSLARFGEAPALWDTVQAVKRSFPELVAVEPWPQGDHMIFVQQGIPAVALSSADAFDLWLNVTHTPADTVEQVSASQIAEAAQFIQALVGATTPA